MSQKILSKQNEVILSPRYHQDGLLDILLSLGILFATVAFSAGLFWLVAILPVLLRLVWVSARHSITDPRLDRGSLTYPRAGKNQPGFILLTILGLVSFALGVVMFWLFATDNVPFGLREWISQNFVLVAWVFGGLLLALIALFAHLPRYFIYALFAFGAGTGGPLLGLQTVTYVVGLAVLMLMVGLLILIRFFRTHPQ